MCVFLHKNTENNKKISYILVDKVANFFITLKSSKSKSYKNILTSKTVETLFKEFNNFTNINSFFMNFGEFHAMKIINPDNFDILFNSSNKNKILFRIINGNLLFDNEIICENIYQDSNHESKMSAYYFMIWAFVYYDRLKFYKMIEDLYLFKISAVDKKIEYENKGCIKNIIKENFKKRMAIDDCMHKISSFDSIGKRKEDFMLYENIYNLYEKYKKYKIFENFYMFVFLKNSFEYILEEINEIFDYRIEEKNHHLVRTLIKNEDFFDFLLYLKTKNIEKNVDFLYFSKKETENLFQCYDFF